MDSELSDVEELTLCNFCKQKFNSTDLCPKILQCKHYFCLKCIETTMIKGRDLFCVNCWKRTEVADGGAADLQTHNPILSLTSRLSLLNYDKPPEVKEAKVKFKILLLLTYFLKPNVKLKKEMKFFSSQMKCAMHILCHITCGVTLAISHYVECV